MATTNKYVPEYIAIVDKTGHDLVVHGCVTRDLAHSKRRIPHTSVLLVPVFTGTNSLLIYRRPQSPIGAGKWDFAGGHVHFEPGMLDGPEALSACIEKTAIREAREEIWIALDGKPYIIQEQDVICFTELGELLADEERNVEFSTGFFVHMPENAEVVIADEYTNDGKVKPLESQRVSLPQLEMMFKEDQRQFADGATRILARGLNLESLRK